MWIFWLVFAGIFFIGEMITTGFLIFWLGLGSVIALIVSLFTSSILIQTIAFVVSSIILILATKPLTDKFTKKDIIPTNVYTLKGKKGIVIEEINPTNSTGQIKVGGEIWSALCDEDLTIEKNTEVEIVRIQGVKAYVTPKKVEVSNTQE